METLTPNQMTADMFDKSFYKKSSVRSGQLVETGAPAYKIITSEDWSIVFPMSEQELTTYNGKTSLAVKFNGRDLETSGAFSTVTGGDGKTYGKLDFSKYMEQFVSDRYVDFEIVTDEVPGTQDPEKLRHRCDFLCDPEGLLRERKEGFFRFLLRLPKRLPQGDLRGWKDGGCHHFVARSTTRMMNTITWMPGRTVN